MTFQYCIDIFAALAALYVGRRLFYPYHCSCGKRIWTGHGILRHLSMKHLYVDPRGKK